MDFSDREYRFDNLKGFLIFLVVFAHGLELYPEYRTDAVIGSLYSVIYSFHMPVFAFISGYFTKSYHDQETQGKKLITSTLIPFFIFHSIYWLIKDRNLANYLTPQFAMWFLLSLFFWRVLVFPITRFNFPLAIALVASLYIGVTNAAKFLSIQRTISFFPFFCSGYLMQKSGGLESFSFLKRSRYIALLMSIVVPVILLIFLKMSPTIYTMSSPYADIGYGWKEGVLFRSIALFLGFCGICWSTAFIPKQQTFLSAYGKRSMMIYVLHPIIIRGWRAFHLPVFTQSVPMIVSAFSIAVIVCLAFGNQYVEKSYRFCFDKINTVLVKQ